MRISEKRADGSVIELRGRGRAAMSAWLHWREAASTPEDKEDSKPGPDKGGAFAAVDRAGQRYYENGHGWTPVVTSEWDRPIIGFKRNEETQ